MILRYKARALKDIEAIHNYVDQFDPEAAKRALRRFRIELIDVIVNRLDVLKSPCLIAQNHLVRRSNVARTSASLAKGSSSARRRFISAICSGVRSISN